MSEIGFGAWGIGGAMWQGGDDAAAVSALGTAFDLGVTFVDTALAYGDGHSERLVARALAGRTEPVVVATKLPPANRVWPAPPGTALAAAFPAGHVTRSARTSAENLGRPLDLLQFHVWRDEWLREDEWKRVERALGALVAAGTVRHVGISINDHDPDNGLEAVRHCDLIECVQVIYNVFDQTPERNLFPACRERDVGVIVRVPLDEGGLTGAVRPGVKFPPGDWRNRYFGGERAAEVARRVALLEPVLRREASSLVEGALRFCLSHPAVSTVIAGMRTAAHARANCAVSDGRTLTPGLLTALREHRWDRNFYG
ncbi:MAG TPA: aldo/keto reductase [Gemmatimonadales bacterium]|nr:aldo/keto reductase [Gemmatimonadales bacterium]